MIKFKLSKDVTGKNVELEYNLPTKLSEIPLEYLVDQTNSIQGSSLLSNFLIVSALTFVNDFNYQKILTIRWLQLSDDLTI